MKQEFLDNKIWKGKLPDIFEKYLEYVFNLGLNEEVDPAELLKILMQLNFSYYQFKWTIIVDRKNLN